MINLQTRAFSDAEQQCIISDNFGIWNYTTLQNPTLEKINEMGASGWHLNGTVFDQPRNIIWYIFEKGGEKKMICGDKNFSIVGQAVGSTGTTEFLISRSWSFGEIAQTSILFVVAACFIFKIIYDIIKRKGYA